jgi:hypothetical protein
MHLPKRAKMLKAKEKLADFNHYAREVLRDNELFFMANLQKNIPGFLSHFISTLVEGATILGHLRDTQVVQEGRLVMPSIKVLKHDKTIHDVKY